MVTKNAMINGLEYERNFLIFWLCIFNSNNKKKKIGIANNIVSGLIRYEKPKLAPQNNKFLLSLLLWNLLKKK